MNTLSISQQGRITVNIVGEEDPDEVGQMEMEESHFATPRLQVRYSL